MDSCSSHRKEMLIFWVRQSFERAKVESLFSNIREMKKFTGTWQWVWAASLLQSISKQT